MTLCAMRVLKVKIIKHFLRTINTGSFLMPRFVISGIRTMAPLILINGRATESMTRRMYKNIMMILWRIILYNIIYIFN